MSARTDLATAAGTVEGITGHPYYEQQTKPGNAFVRLDRIEYPNSFGGVCYWNVILILPQDQAGAEKYLEEKLPDLRDALAPHLHVTQVLPQRISIPGIGDLLCAFINGNREE